MLHHLWLDLGKPSVTHARPIFTIGVFSESFHILWKSSFDINGWTVLYETAITDANSFWQDQYKPKCPDMFKKPSGSLYSVRRALLGMPITKCAQVLAAVNIWQSSRSISLSFALLNAIDAARTLNTLFWEDHNLFGGCDGPALSNFVQEFFCGDDGDGKWNVLTTYLYFTQLLL